MNYFKYFSEIEEAFIRRRGRNLLLSPLDWALIEAWQERGIPLRIVLRGIEKVFDTYDKKPDRRRPIKSLMYCREEIEAQYAEWKDSQIGKNGAEAVALEEPPGGVADSALFSSEAVTDHLKKISLELAEALKIADGELKQVLEKIADRLEKLGKTRLSDDKTEEILEKCDALVDEVLLRCLVTEELKNETKKQISAYRNKMEKEVFQRTLELMLVKNLREKRQIPQFSLFYL